MSVRMPNAVLYILYKKYKYIISFLIVLCNYFLSIYYYFFEH